MKKLMLAFAAIAAVLGAKAELPSGYTALPYVKSTGSQWIDTKVTLKNTYRVEMDFMPQSVPGDQSGILIFGARNGSAAKSNFSTAWTKTTGFYSDFHSNTSRRMAYKGMSAGTRYYLTVDKEHAQLMQVGEDEPVAESSTLVENTFETVQTCHLLSVNTDVSSSDAYKGYAKFTGFLYAFKITDCESGEMVRDFVPCKQMSDGVIGLYDLHEGKFYPSEGTKGFAGPELPDDYIRLPYIRSTGTQWIDTNIKLKSSYQVELDFEPTKLASNIAIFGARNGAAGKLNFSAAWTSTSKFFADFYKSTSRRTTYAGMAADTRYHLTMNKDFTQLKQEGLDEPVAKDTDHPVGEAFTTVQTCLLLSVNTTTGDGIRGYDKLSGLLYAFKVVDEKYGVVVDMVPVRNGAGVCGLYDIVRDKFYGNSGEGVFSCDGDIVVDNETVTAARFSALDDYCVDPADDPASLVLSGENPIFQNTREGARTNSVACTTTTSTGSIGVFGCPNGLDYRSSVAIYSVRIWQNGSLVHDFIPCRRLADGVGGLYDLIDQSGETVGLQFFENIYSAANFRMPSKALGATPSADYERVAWIRADGNQIVDTGYTADSDTKVEVVFNSCRGDVDGGAVIGHKWAKSSWLLRIDSGKFSYYDDVKSRDLGVVAQYTDYRVTITSEQTVLEPLLPAQTGSLATAFAFGNGIGDDGVGGLVKAMPVRFEPIGNGFAEAPIRSMSTQRGIALYDGTIIEVSGGNLGPNWRKIPLMYDASGFAQTPLDAAKLAKLEASATLPKGSALVYDAEQKTLVCKHRIGLLILFE